MYRYVSLGSLAPFVAALTLAGCTGQHKKPNITYMPDMMQTAVVKAQREGSMRMPPKGTVPRGFQPYRQVGMKAEEAGKFHHNPLQRTKLVLERGQNRYETYCIVCHGKMGEGDGSIVPKFPRPPSLQSDKVMKWPDGNLFHVISAGQNLMPSYAAQVPVKDRWAIIHYIRALQRAKHPTPDDLKAAQAAGY